MDPDPLIDTRWKAFLTHIRSSRITSLHDVELEVPMPDYPMLLEKLGPEGLDELRRLVADEVAKRAGRQDPPTTMPSRPGTMPGPDEDLRPRS